MHQGQSPVQRRLIAMLEEHDAPLDTFELAAGVYQVGQASKSLSDIGNGCGPRKLPDVRS
jgi:hypothetical protein